MKKYVIYLAAIASLGLSFSARAEYQINVSDKNGVPSHYTLLKITSSTINQIGDGELWLTGRTPSDGSGILTIAGVTITRKALETAGVSARELLSLLKENENTRGVTITVIYDVPSERLSILQLEYYRTPAR